MQNYTHFSGIDEGFKTTIRQSSIGWLWELYKDGLLIDHCYNHSPTNNELACKAQVERIVKDLKQNI
jgi:hypothetical protein